VNPSNLSQLRIDPDAKRRPGGSVKAIFIVIALALVAAGYFAWPRPDKDRRVFGSNAENTPPSTVSATAAAPTAQKSTTTAATALPSAPQNSARDPQSSLTVSGYIINRERIEVSPRFQGVVAWIGVKKGDTVEKDQIVVRLEDAEQRANVATIEGRLAAAQVALERAELAYRRIHDLYRSKVVSDDSEDDARLTVAAAHAAIREIEGQLSLARTNLDWTVIRSPISGVVLEKLAEPGGLVTPQSFGGTRGPSTAVLAVADPRDLQVELDINESDLAKIALGDKCRVIPEAYPDLRFDGVVAEISPEANRQKGTLQIKVGILNPDRHLTPELTAKVEFLH